VPEASTLAYIRIMHNNPAWASIQLGSQLRGVSLNRSLLRNLAYQGETHVVLPGGIAHDRALCSADENLEGRDFMIELYSWPTPNGHKIHIMLEETGLAYRVHGVDIGRGDQFDPAFLAISPNNKIPAIVDGDGPAGEAFSLFESGAILLYLAEKAGMFLPTDAQARYDVIQWLMFQMGAIGPLLGQAHHFRAYAPERIPYAIDRYTREAARLYGVLDRRLADRSFVAGDYSIADMAIYPWLRYWERQGVEIASYSNLKRWFDAISARPAVQRGLQVLSERARSGPMDEKAKEVLFGATQYARR
jgi:GSH-dependent disulfide-bond oxidoreductase